MTAQQNADDLLRIWQLQRQIGVKPEERRLPADDSYSRDLDVIRRAIERH